MIAVIDDPRVVEKILRHLGAWHGPACLPEPAAGRPAGLSPPGAAGPYTYEPCDNVDPHPGLRERVDRLIAAGLRPWGPNNFARRRPLDGPGPGVTKPISAQVPALAAASNPPRQNRPGTGRICPLTGACRSWQHPPVMNAARNQFSLTREASKPAARRKSKFLSVLGWSVPATPGGHWLFIVDEHEKVPSIIPGTNHRPGSKCLASA